MESILVPQTSWKGSGYMKDDSITDLFKMLDMEKMLTILYHFDIIDGDDFHSMMRAFEECSEHIEHARRLV